MMKGLSPTLFSLHLPTQLLYIYIYILYNSTLLSAHTLFVVVVVLMDFIKGGGQRERKR